MQIPTVKITADNAKGFKIVNADDPRAASSCFDRDSLAELSKEEICELLEAHGLKADKRRALEALRSELGAVVFMEAEHGE